MKRNFNKLLAAVLTASLCIPAFPAEYVPAAVTDEISGQTKKRYSSTTTMSAAHVLLISTKAGNSIWATPVLPRIRILLTHPGKMSIFRMISVYPRISLLPMKQKAAFYREVPDGTAKNSPSQTPWKENPLF